MALALWLGALLVVGFDIIPMSLRLELDLDVSTDLLLCLPRWALALPLACAAWGALGDALAARLEAARGLRLAGAVRDGWLAAPLLACLPQLFAGPAIRASAWRVPALTAALLATLLGVALARRALDALATAPRRLGARHLPLLLPPALVGVTWLTSQITFTVLRGLYPTFHVLMSLATLLAAGLLMRLLLRLRPPHTRRGPGTRLLLALAAAGWVLSGFVGLGASMGRLALIEGAPIVGALVGPAHALDVALLAAFEPSPSSAVVRRVQHAALVPAGPLRRNVLLITVDALRADALDPSSAIGRCMPRLNALAARSVHHRRAYAPSNETVVSVIGMLTGRTRLPGEGAASARELLPYAFSRAGWSTYAWFTVHDMPTVRNDLLALSQSGFGFDAYRKEYRGADVVLRWAGDRFGSEPSFVWVHLSDVHMPLHLPLVRPTRLAGCDDPYLVRHATLDSVLADAIQARTARDPSLLWVISSDHGESRGERGAHGHGGNLHDEQVRVPFLAGGAGLEPTDSSDVRSLFELGPALLATASRAAPAPSLAWPVAAQPARALLVSRRECGLVSESYKLIANPGAGTLALHDLSRDPGEQDNLVAREPARARDMLQQLAQDGCPHPGLQRLAPR